MTITIITRIQAPSVQIFYGEQPAENGSVYYAPPVTQSPKNPIAKRLRDLERGLNKMEIHLKILSVGLARTNLINLQQKQQDAKWVKEQLNYFEREICTVEKLIPKNDSGSRVYTYVLGSIKNRKAELDKSLEKLAEEVEHRCIQLSKLRDIEERLFMIGSLYADIELQIIFVELNEMDGPDFLYDEQRRKLLLNAYEIQSSLFYRP